MVIENISGILTIIIGIIGISLNILNIIIATRKPCKGSFHIYLITLSVVDGLFLLTILPVRFFRCGSGCLEPPSLSVS